MSRNLCTTSCVECKAGGPIVLEEPPRAPTKADVGVYFNEYAGSTFANAHCRSCEAQYLAWMSAPGYGGMRGNDDGTHCDLSYRSSFNHEHGSREDRAQYEIEVVYRRVRRIQWCRHGHRELTAPVENCHDCRRGAELRDPRVADMLCVQFKYGPDADWTVHYNSPLSDDRAVIEASWIWNGGKPVAHGWEKRIARVRAAVTEIEEPTP